MNATQLRNVVDHVAGRRAPLPVSHPWHVLVELADTGGEQALNEAASRSPGARRECRPRARRRHRIERRAARRSLGSAPQRVGGQQEGRHGDHTDCAVPVSAVPQFIERATLAAHAILPGAPIIVVAHLGDGNVHFIPVASFEQWRAFDDADAVSHRVKHAINQVAHELGGTFSAEHGVGQVLTQEMSLFKPAVEIDLMRGIKALLDPDGLFNPGRLLPTASTVPHQPAAQELP